MSALEVIDSIGRTHRPPYSERVRAAAYEAWCLSGQSCEQVAALLESDPEWRAAAGIAHGDLVPDVSTIRRWCKDETWLRKRQNLMAAEAPISATVAALRLVAAAPGAADTVARLATSEGPLDRNQRMRLDAAKFVLSTVLGDRLAEHLQVADPIDVDLELDSLTTMEQIEAAERRYRESRGT